MNQIGFFNLEQFSINIPNNLSSIVLVNYVIERNRLKDLTLDSKNLIITPVLPIKYVSRYPSTFRSIKARTRNKSRNVELGQYRLKDSIDE